MVVAVNEGDLAAGQIQLPERLVQRGPQLGDRLA